uniref:phage tail tape measure protein n=1 Tax=Rhodosalinus sp. TaxID=2047741 RepID=UPI003568A280
AERLLALPLDARIREVTEAIRANAAASEQAALFSQLFGDRAFTAFQRIDPAVLAQARAELDRFGALVSESDAAQVERTNDAITRLGLVWRGLSNQLTVAVAPALERMAVAMAELADRSGPLGVAIAWLGRNLQRVATYAGAFAALIAVRLVGRIAAFAVGIRGAATALVLLRRVMARLPFVGLVIAITEVAMLFPRLVRGAGSFGNALRLLRDVAVAVWEGIKTSASSLVPALGAVWQEIRAGFFQMLEALSLRWHTFLHRLGTGLEGVPGFGGAAEGLLAGADRALDRMSRLNAAASSAEGAAIRLRREAAARVADGGAQITEAWTRLREAVARGSQAASGELDATGAAARRLREEIAAAAGLNGEDGESGGAAGALGRIGSAAGAAGEAMEQAARRGGEAWAQAGARLREAQEAQRRAAQRLAEDITGPLKRALASGEFSWRTFADAVSQIAQNLATRLINAAFKPIEAAIVSALTGGGTGGGFLGRLFGLGGFARGGVFDRAGEVQAFARGGIVDRPTVFPFARGAGLMGEAGPEAILPLRRGRGGRLGVETTGDTAPPPTTRIINVLDPAIVGDYLATPAGERLIVNTIRRNRGALDA